jgi:hypothetical protein
MFVVPRYPHLQRIEMVVNYRELVEGPNWPPRPGKWRQDPGTDPNQMFHPAPKSYVNGVFVKQAEQKIARTQDRPFQKAEGRVPRKGYRQVYPDDPEYETLCKEQGLYHLLPTRESSATDPAHVNDMTPPNFETLHNGSPRHIPNGVPDSLIILTNGTNNSNGTNGTNGIDSTNGI